MTDEYEFLSIYIEEMKEHLDKINEALLILDADYNDKDCINDLFRSVHTIKGSTGAMNFMKTAKLIHKMEDTIQGIRDEKICINENILKTLFKIYDYLQEFVDAVSNGEGEDSLKNNEYLYEELSNSFEEEEKIAIEIQSNGIKINSSDLENIDLSSNNILSIHVKLSDDCVLKDIRLWMTFTELSKLTNIISCNPNKDVMSQVDNLNLGSDYIDFIVYTPKDANDLKVELECILSEISIINIEKLELKDGYLHGDLIDFDKNNDLYFVDHIGINLLNMNIDLAMNEIIDDEKREDDKEDVAEEDCFLSKYIYEIETTVEEAKCTFKHINKEDFDIEKALIIYKYLNHIKGIALFIERDFLYKICVTTLEMLECIENDKFDKQSISLIEKSLDIISIIFIHTDSEVSDEIKGELNEHINTINEEINYYKSKIFDQENIDTKRLGEILVEQGKLKQTDIEEALNLQKEKYPNLKLGQVLVKEKKVNLKDVSEAIDMQKKTVKEVKPDIKSISYLRIPEYKVDSLFNLLGELMIMQSQQKEDISSIGVEEDTSKLYNNMLRMERVTREIQGITMTLRMVSIKQTFQKVLRIGRDTAKELNKNVKFELIGEETEIDRSVVDKLYDPLMHLVRNSISHGIEDSEQDRLNIGKTREGNVKIAAWNKRGTVYIEIADDGNGMDEKRILNKAIQRGLADENIEYSQSEIINFIFSPGFSTQEQVNSVAGRGVGMNVVEEEIKKAGGKVEVKTQKGRGSSFILKIPINLSTINGIIVDMYGTRYVIPTISIKRIFKCEEDEFVSVKGNVEMVKSNGDIIKIINIKEIVESFNKVYSMIVIIEHNNELRALPVKSVLGKQEVVIKPLSDIFSRVPFISGVTIMGDGTAAFILDIEYFFKE